MQKDGSLARKQKRVDIDVAAAAFDLFDAYEGALRPFFAAIGSSTTLRWLSVPNAGLDSPVFSSMLARGVRITNAHVTDIPISEYVLRAVLDHFQQAELWRDAQRRTAWDRHQFREVAGTRWLIVGLGTIGSAVAVRAKAFGAHVTGCRRSPTGSEPVDAFVAPPDLHAALPTADVVVLCLPSASDAPPLVDAAFLDAMGPRSVLVNIARGSLIDEAALVSALDRGRPEAALLDVMVTEPLPAESPLWRHPAVVLTPHNSAGGFDRYGRYDDLLVDNLGRFARGEALRNEITLATIA
ncbi:MAG TPA: D-2-hydroxyacid dehydrogenase [Acidimicrobiales bacterium]|nr:D-2-hydroxyacid dehydrogenase [Acidimicrobiales bacterium]